MTKKPENFAEVNSSYTTFFLLAIVGMTFVFSTKFGDLSNASIAVLIAFALLLYFVWDFIKQLYSPGQAVFLFAMTFIVLPFVMNFTLQYPYGRIGGVILLGALLVAGLLEFIYELVLKRLLPKFTLKRLLLLDNKIDKSFVQISDKHLLLYEYRGFSFAILLITTFYVLSYLLLHS